MVHFWITLRGIQQLRGQEEGEEGVSQKSMLVHSGGGGLGGPLNVHVDQNLKKIQLQQGLEIRCFWFQKKTVQLKTALHEVYTYVLKGIFFQKQCNFKASVYHKVTVM